MGKARWLVTLDDFGEIDEVLDKDHECEGYCNIRDTLKRFSAFCNEKDEEPYCESVADIIDKFLKAEGLL